MKDFPTSPSKKKHARKMETTQQLTRHQRRVMNDPEYNKRRTERTMEKYHNDAAFRERHLARQRALYRLKREQTTGAVSPV